MTSAEQAQACVETEALAEEDVEARRAIISAASFEGSATEIEVASSQLAESELEPVTGGSWKGPLTCPQAECPEVAFRVWQCWRTSRQGNERAVA